MTTTLTLQEKPLNNLSENCFLLLRYINQYFDINNKIPTYTCMRTVLGISSNSTIGFFIDRLINNGYLMRTKLGKGNLIITDKGKMTDKIYRLCPMCGHLN